MNPRWFRCKWSLALLVAALGTPVNQRQGWTRLWKAFALWLGIVKSHGAKVDIAEYHRRLRVCEACPVYFEALSTCGSPLRGDGKDLGCWCYMPAAAKFSNKTCWGDDNFDDFEYGWKRSGQNSTPCSDG